MNTRTALRAAARRLRHRSRSVAVSVALALAAIAAAWVGTEAVLKAVGAPRRQPSPGAVVEALSAGGWAATLAGGLLVAVGLVAVALALLPGRLPRRRIADDRTIWLIDDAVLASGLTRVAARAANVAPRQVRTTVSRRVASSRITPSTGFEADAAAARAALAEALDTLQPTRALRPHVTVDRTGVLS